MRLRSISSLSKPSSLLLSLFCALFLNGCLRYTPPRSEIKEQEKAGQETASQFGSQDDFLAHEKRLEERLESLISERGAMDGQGGYRLGAGDTLSFEVYGFNNLSGEIEIAPDGIATFPMIGDVRASGRSLADFREDVTARVRRYVKNPRVRLAMKNFEASKVSVIGEVAKPGSYPLKREGLLVSELLAEAGGRTQKAGNRIVVIPSAKSVDRVNNSGYGVEIDLEDITGTVDKAPMMIPLAAGDTIMVPEAGKFEVDGEVIQPGSFTLSNRTSVLGAIASAGGLSYSAKADEVEVIREIGSGKKAVMSINIEDVALRGHSDIRLRDGDIIRVPSDSGRFTRRQIVETINSVFRGVGVSSRAN